MQALGSAYSALVTYEYTKLKAERKARLAKGESPKRVDARWQQIVGEASQSLRRRRPARPHGSRSRPLLESS